jgi:hypothetical protein
MRDAGIDDDGRRREEKKRMKAGDVRYFNGWASSAVFMGQVAHCYAASLMLKEGETRGQTQSIAAWTEQAGVELEPKGGGLRH